MKDDVSEEDQDKPVPRRLPVRSWSATRWLMSAELQVSAYILLFCPIPLVMFLSISLELYIVGLVLPPLILFGALFFGVRFGVFLDGLRERVHIALPGRYERDQCWLQAWAWELDYQVEALEPVRGVDQHEVLLPAMPSSLPLRLWGGGRTQLTAATLASIEEGASRLRIEPQYDGFSIELQMKLPEAWQRALVRCVAEEEVSLSLWVSSAVMSGDEDLLVRPFVLAPMDDSMDESSLLALDETALWMVFRQRYLKELVCCRAYWCGEDYSLRLVERESLIGFELVLDSLCAIRDRFWHFMCECEEPLLDQIVHELLGRGHYFEEKVADANEERTQIEPNVHWREDQSWWLFLCERYQEEEGLRLALQRLFLESPPSPYLYLLFERAEPAVREAVLVPFLCQFLQGAWLDMLQYRFMTSGVSREETRLERMGVCFSSWHTLLKTHLPAPAYRSLCQSIIESEPPDIPPEERELIQLWRVGALDHWLWSADITRDATLVRWWSMLGATLLPHLLLALHKHRVYTPEFEISLHPHLLAARKWLSTGEQQLRMLVLQYLEDMGTNLSKTVLQELIDTWHATLGLESIYLAKRVLRKLRDAPMEGAMSWGEEDEPDAKGKLSLSGEEAAKGQLSLEDASEPPETLQ